MSEELWGGETRKAIDNFPEALDKHIAALQQYREAQYTVMDGRTRVMPSPGERFQRMTSRPASR